MPIREYKCPRCGASVELLRWPSEEREGDPPCPHCGETLHRQISAPAPSGQGGGCGTGGSPFT